MNEQIFVQINDERIELTGADKEAFLVDRAAMQAEQEAKEIARASALGKLADLGLTAEEIAAL